MRGHDAVRDREAIAGTAAAPLVMGVPVQLEEMRAVFLEHYGSMMAGSEPIQGDFERDAETDRRR